jgi:hypothetical protein
MGLTANAGSGTFKPVPPGKYVARCFSVLDLGHQTSATYGTSTHKIRLAWEIFGEDEDGQPLVVVRDGKTLPMTVSAEYTMSLNEKAHLRKHLEFWRGRAFTAEELKGFDISKLLGAYCELYVTQSTGKNGKTYSNVSTITPLSKTQQASKPAGVHGLESFDLDDPDMELFEHLPPYVQEKIKASPEWDQAQNRFRPATPTQSVSMDDDDVPF